MFDSAEGAYLYTPDGRKVLDGIASWWAVAFGHSHPKIVRAIREQAGILQHSILGNQSHPLAIRLAARLAEFFQVQVQIAQQAGYVDARSGPVQYRLL